MAASCDDGSRGGWACAVTHRSKAPGDCAITRKPMWACWIPQNSAHTPRYVPAFSAVNRSTFRCPGMVSTFPASSGTQKLCTTLSDSSPISTCWPTGMWSSLAVTIWRPG